jgi:adenylate cyclase
MAEQKNNRRLAAILAADVVGYSRMMGADEAGTLFALRHHREAIFDPAVAEHNGRVFKLMGDGTLVEFPSVVEAVRCAVAIQRAAHSQQPADGPVLTLRIGVNLGDVILDGDDLYGDGINVAARLEPLAEPGGICVASIVIESVGNRIDADFIYSGEVAVKNIERPIRVWKWHPDRGTVTSGGEAATHSNHDQEGTVDGSPNNPAVPDKPSIAVLPFANLSGDAEQEYFADGISEDIITALSRISWFFVIARNTTFTYKGKAVDVRQVARELGVRYVLEGSVRKSGNRIRITGQLVDGKTGNHLWAEKYDRHLEDVFAVQDEITENIAGALEPQLAVAENTRSKRKAKQNLDAWDLVIQALARIGEFSKTGSSEALVLLDRAIDIDPTYARAYSQKAWTLAWRVLQGWEDVETAIPTTISAAEKAIQYDPDEPWAYIAWFFISAITHDGQKMLSSASRAIELNPNFALAHSFFGVAHACTGQGAEAFQWIEKARRLSPRDVFRIEFDVHTSYAYFQLADYKKATEFAIKALEPKPDHFYPHLILAASHAHLDAMDAARNTVSKLLQLMPGYSLGIADEFCVYVTPDDKARFLDGLRKAGLPE